MALGFVISEKGHLRTDSTVFQDREFRASPFDVACKVGKEDGINPALCRESL